MGTKGHGTYAKLFRDVWTHPKTFRLARSIAALGYPERAAKREAVGQLHELLCWCIAQSDDGQVGHLPAAEFARIVGWDDPRRAQQLFAAWVDSGFLDVHGDGDIRVHDFTDAAADLLRKRANRRPSSGGASDDDDAERPPDGRRVAAQRPPDGRPLDGPRARAGSGSGSGSGSGRPPSEVSPLPPGEEAPPEGPPERIADAWAEACPHLPQPDRPLAPGIRAKLVAVAKRERARDWGATFGRVSASGFLSGRKKDWRADLLWCVGPENLAKLDAGAYDDHAAAAAPPPNRRATQLAGAAAEASRLLDAAFGDGP